jgi:ABC-type branched-subunit amino acid transport system substrate-binding protein
VSALGVIGERSTSVAVVAPAIFGDAAVAYLDAAVDALAKTGRPRRTLVADAGDLRRALDPLAEGDVVLGSLGSELGAEVAHVAAERGLVHVEAGAIADDAVGPNSFRLTPAKAELARAAAELVLGRRVALVVEQSVMGRAMGAAVRTELAARAIDLVTDDDVGEVLADPGGWQRLHRVDAVVAALRGALPEQFVTALARSGGGVEVCVGAAGSWTRAAVGRATDGTRACRVVFCEVMAPRAAGAPPDAEAPSLYADLGRAAGAVVARALRAGRPARVAVCELVLDAADSPLGYGVRFGDGGRNELARAALLQWQDGAITTYDPGGRA